VNKIITKTIGFSLIIGIILAFIGLILLISIEIFLNESKTERIELHKTEYYGEQLNKNPYKDYIVQYLHPYYLFSLPWQKDDQENLESNNVVLLNNAGFRDTSKQNSNEQKIILLGGSTAFSHFSSSNETTISSYLNNLVEQNVINRNAPSWNSHQEAIALFKFDKLDMVDASISFSLGNDISLNCRGSSRYSDLYHDFPESWNVLNEKVNDLRGILKPESFITKSKKILRGIFPNTYTKLVELKLKSIQQINHEVSLDKFGTCTDNDVAKVAESFISNQKRMMQLSKAYDFNHFLIIQPSFYVHKDALIKDNFGKQSRNFRKKVINYVLNSNYCIDNPCLDLSSVFDNLGFYLEMYNSINNSSDSVNNWMDLGIFIDAIHINDRGNQIIANRINDFLDLYI
jgi:lysophospholipase L1-like esterase